MMAPAEEDSRSRRGRFRANGLWRAELHYGSPLYGYFLAFVLLSVTGVVSLAVMGRAEFPLPFLLCYPAIALISFLCGAGPGLAAILVGAFFALLIYPHPPAALSWIALSIIGPLVAAGFARLRGIRERSLAIGRELVQFKFISDHASDWILLLAESGQIRYVNHKASTDLGWTARELNGRDIESLVPEDQRPGLRAALDMARSGTAKPVEIVFERSDRSRAPVELVCTAVRTEKERVIYAAARDTGERRQIEKKLSEIRHWESLGALAGGLAHDFNNLFTSILGNATLARDILPADHETAPLLADIISATERSAEFVRLMLATSGYRPHFRERLELDQLLERTLLHLELPPNVRIAKETCATHFMGDRRSFETLFRSLISNAAEAYGEKGGEVRVAIRTGPVPGAGTASFEEGDPGPGECLGIVVEDRGSGMPPEVLKRAFDPFFSTRFTGRGLGLPAVRGIVRAYSGRLLVETTASQGTRVEVWLPASRSDLPGAAGL